MRNPSPGLFPRRGGGRLSEVVHISLLEKGVDTLNCSLPYSTSLQVFTVRRATGLCQSWVAGVRSDSVPP